MPKLGNRPIDLYLLYHEVQRHGGLDNLDRNRKGKSWDEVAKIVLGITNSVLSKTYQVREIYREYLVDFAKTWLGIQSVPTAW